MPRKKKTARKSTSKPLQDLSIAELNEELERRRSGAVELAEERAELMERVAEIDAYLSELGVSTTTGRPRGRPRKNAAGGTARSHGGGRKKASRSTAKKATTRQGGKRAGKKAARKTPSKPGGTRKRHRNDANLVESLQQVLRGKTMGVTEAADAVQQAGYKTTSPNFRTIVNQTLIKNPDVFSKQGRGLYTAK
jgi:hypothetical protein